MAAQIPGIFRSELETKINSSRLLIVGAGGIGCEVLKNCVLSGFPRITILDLDTIELSNLNRQFLFHKEHVGRSKAEVAKESALKFNPKVEIEAFCDNITSSTYGISFFKQFNVVLNALDNKEARNHVNRMCLIADVPLVESGTAGYNGQVELIKSQTTQCYECQPKAAQKSYPGCTIRNTPSEPIHCIVWAKHLFNQLFGEYNADEDVSPDTADPEAAGEAGKEALSAESNEKGNVERVSTRKWAENCGYSPEKLFNKLFHDDINYLLSMSNLWKNRTAPKPIKWSEFDEPGTSDVPNGDVPTSGLKDQKVWTLAECAKVFEDSVNVLKESVAKLAEDDHLVWDKDDKDGMDFVASCANIRAHIFAIVKKNRFDIKSMAGNIIPAIATTNAITAGIVVNRAFKVLTERYDQCQSVYIRLRPNPRNQIFIPDRDLTPPNPTCAVCSSCRPEVTLKIDTKSSTIKELKEKVLLAKLTMETPEVILDGKGLIIVSSEEDEATLNDDKKLEEMGIVDGCVLKVDDFDQNFEVRIVIIHDEEGIAVDINEELLTAAKAKNKKEDEAADAEMPTAEDLSATKSNTEPSSGPSQIEDDDDDDDICIVEEPDSETTADDEAFDDVTEVIVAVPSPVAAAAAVSPKPDLKRKVADTVVEIEDQPAPTKKPRLTDDSDDDCMIVDDVVVID